jgi:hypothetical protein
MFKAVSKVSLFNIFHLDVNAIFTNDPGYIFKGCNSINRVTKTVFSQHQQVTAMVVVAVRQNDNI